MEHDPTYRIDVVISKFIDLGRFQNHVLPRCPKKLKEYEDLEIRGAQENPASIIQIGECLIDK